jgi:hypothetical protein
MEDHTVPRRGPFRLAIAKSLRRSALTCVDPSKGSETAQKSVIFTSQSGGDDLFFLILD